MKKITNWRNATVFDVEADGLLDQATKIHVLSCKMANGQSVSIKGDDHNRLKKFFKHHIDNGLPVVAHNGISYDVVLAEKLLGIDLSKLMVIDTLALSWYLNMNRNSHGLDSFHEDYGIAKPKIDDWENLTYEEYRHRCEEDVKINSALWEDFKERLVEMYTLAQVEIDQDSFGGKRLEGEALYVDQYKGGDVDSAIDRILTFLMFKMDCANLQETTKWDVDMELLTKSIEEMEAEVEKAKTQLESVMPTIPKYVHKKKPAKPFLKNGELSSTGLAWEEVKSRFKNKEKDEHGNLLVKVSSKPDHVMVLSKYEEPNAASSAQVKDFLFSKGWQPCSFKYERDEEAMAAWARTKPGKGAGHREWNDWKARKPQDRKIPQITVVGDNGKELCPSVEALAEDFPEIRLYADYNVAKHRLSVLKGFMNAQKDGKLKARINGFTNTLRVCHSEIVNLPGVDKPYGDVVRGVLVAGDGHILVGSDLASLEDRCKHHLMLPHDPDYVADMMSPDFDPHIATALFSGMITQKEFDDFKSGIKPMHVIKARKAGKCCLPTDNTQVMTSLGWKTYDEISVGDSVLSMNNETEEVEFCKVDAKWFYENQQVTRMVSRGWEVESTPDHRWYVKSKTGRVRTTRKVKSYKTTEKLLRSDNIISTGEYVGGSSGVSDSQASLLGWILADGYLSVSELTGRTAQGTNGERQAVKMSVAQDDNKFIGDLENTINECGLNYKKYKNNSGVNVFQFSQPDARKFIKDLGLPMKSKHDIDYTEFMLGLSKSALKSFFEAFWLADGHTASAGTKYNTKVIYQNGGNILDAVQLCAELLGMTTTKKLRNGTDNFYVLRCKSSPERGLQRTEFVDSRVTDVFCLTTENSNFFIRQDDVVMLTGNCNYASVYGAGGPKIAQAAGVSEAEGKKLHEGYWKLNWSVLEIAEEQAVIKTSRNETWLVNPINGFCYSLRSEKDRFSTLAQGTGSFFFDMWVDNILEEQYERFGKRTLTGSFHDENIFKIKDTQKARDLFADMIQRSIDRVNKTYNLRRDLGCESQFGYRYSAIH